MEGEKWVSFLTLTSRPGITWPLLMKAWSTFVKVLRRRYGPLGYLAVKEEGTATGMRHLHVLITGAVWLNWPSMSRAWSRLTGAPGVDIRRVNTRGGKTAYSRALYVCKYIGKGFGQDAPMRKLLTASAGFFKPTVSEHSWTVMDWTDAYGGYLKDLPGSADERGIVVLRECRCMRGELDLDQLRLDTGDTPQVSWFQLPLPEG